MYIPRSLGICSLKKYRMNRTIAIAGKGGTGKTTFTSLLIKYLLKEKNGNILAVDGDPNSNLADFLGIKQESSIVGIIDEVSKNINSIPAGMTKDRYLEYRLNSALTESEGFDLLAMGRPEGPGCYCYVNHILRDLIKRLSDNYDYLVIDNEAGMEHFSRRTTRRANVLYIITTYTPIGFRSARRIYDLVKELNLEIKKTYLVINQVSKRNNLLDDRIKDLGIELAGYLPQDAEIIRRSVNNDCLLNLPEKSIAFKSAKDIFKKTLEEI
jgi:CO dehydrogenase maturation factor